jgi:hypothetical protein
MVNPFQNGKNRNRNLPAWRRISLQTTPRRHGDITRAVLVSLLLRRAKPQQLLQIAYTFDAQGDQHLLPELRCQERVGQRMMRILWPRMKWLSSSKVFEMFSSSLTCLNGFGE